MQKLIFVSSGLKSPKKGNSPVFRRQRYLNYGLLSLANSEHVEDGSVYHGHFNIPYETLLEIEQSHNCIDKAIYLISCPSFLALNWARDFVSLVAEKYSSARFIIGGRWVVDGNTDFIRKTIPQIEFVFEGLGEANLSDYLLNNLNFSYERTSESIRVFDNTRLSFLNYRKLADANAFVPSFEGSRGCGAGCRFCAEANVQLTRLKPPSTLCAEIAQYFSGVPKGVNRFYLEASNFTPRIDWIQSFREERRKTGLDDVTWRTEARVDLFSQRSIEVLAQTGLKVLDLGLESASPKQLIRMGKTRNPEKYLDQCSRLIKTASENGILAKLNILLYPGETDETISETAEWLEKNMLYFAGISVYPTLYYGLTPSTDPVMDIYKSLGATLSSTKPTGGIQHLNLSKAIPHPDSEQIARELSRRFMTDSEYYALKSFSYFDPSYTEHQFKLDIQRSDPDKLPFRVST